MKVKIQVRTKTELARFTWRPRQGKKLQKEVLLEQKLQPGGMMAKPVIQIQVQKDGMAMGLSTHCCHELSENQEGNT